MLDRLSTEMVRAQKEFFGKGPLKAKSHFVDDMLFIVMQGGLTTAEKTMMEFGEQDRVRDFRQAFENQMTERLRDMVEEITGRKVLTYQSQILFGPDRVIEMFIFDKPARDDVLEATAEAISSDQSIGEVSGDDEESTSGQEH